MITRIGLAVFAWLMCGMTVVADQPNVIVFFIDDLGYKDLGCYGSEFHETPRIDELSRKSVRFTRFYSAHPVCSPTRAALMTGKAPQRLGITQWISQPSDTHVPDEEITLGEAFIEAGYDTGYIGKWHLGDEDDQMPDHNGFPWMRGVNRAGSPGSYFYPYRRQNRRNGKQTASLSDVPDLEDGKPGDYLTDGLTDHALDFISQKRDKPFFLCFAHYAVHTPIQSPKALEEKYRGKLKDAGAEKVDPNPERNNALSRARQDNATYAGMVENLDMNVGRILDRLTELGLGDNTIIVFTSDNGGLSTLPKRVGPTSVVPLRAGKGWCYEGGVRIPTLICWPSQLKPSENPTPGITMDLYPTLLELAGMDSKPSQHLDGVSLVSTLRGETDRKTGDRVLGWHYPHRHGSGHTPSSCIQVDGWKLLWLSDVDQYELYHVDEDLSERKNLAERYPDKVKQLSEKLHQWLEETDVK